MATKYTFYSTAASSIATTHPYRVVMEFNVTSNIESNVSIIDWSLKADGSDTSKSAYWSNFEFSIYEYPSSDDIILYKNTPGTVRSKQEVVKGSYTLPHKIDGTQTIGIKLVGYATASSSDYYYNSYNIMKSASGGAHWSYPKAVELVLPTIPRTSTVTCSTVEIGRNPTISINSPSPKFTHTLRYSFGSLTGTIASKITSLTYNNWSIPTSFLSEIKEAKFGEGTIYCDTYNGDTFNGTTSTKFRVNIPSTYGPTISPTIQDINTKTLSLTGDANKIVQYFSNVSFDIGAFTSTGATIKSVKITCGNKSASTMTGTLNNVESNAFTITATDSRGFTTTETFYKTLVPYNKLTAKLQLVSIDTNGFGSVSISGNLFRGSFGEVENEPVISYRYKAQSGSWGNWTEVVYNIYNDSYYVDIPFYNLDYQETYIFEAKAVDQLMTVAPEQLVVKCMPVFDWNDNDFQFNVPVTISGDLIVNGTVTSENEPSAQADFIVEYGITDGWMWRKWNSGFAECWCKKSVTTTITTAWGSLFSSGPLTASDLTFPFTFKDVPTVNVTVTNNGAGVFLMASGSWAPPTVSTSGAFELVRAISATTSNSYGLNYQVNGRWK